MLPIDHFNSVWLRCNHLVTLHTDHLLSDPASTRADELLRAQWAMRVSALDLYVHETVAQKMLDIFERRRPVTPAYSKFKLSSETVDRIRAAATPSDAGAAFDLEVREHFSRKPLQDPEEIAAAIRCCSEVELWNEIAVRLGATETTKIAAAKQLRTQLSLIVSRRHKIVHEGDLMPFLPRDPWPIAVTDLLLVTKTIRDIVDKVDAIL